MTTEITATIALHYGRNGIVRFKFIERLIRSLQHKNSSALVLIDGTPSCIVNDGDRITATPLPTDAFRARQFCAELSTQLAELPAEVRSLIS